MKAVILAGGYGTRLAEETQTRPKPMVPVGNRPILWHIMKHYSAYGIHDFIICLGYKGHIIKDYFANYHLHHADMTLDLQSQRSKVLSECSEPWRVTLVDTGENVMTGGRLKRVRDYVGNEDFCFTYGDGLSDVPVDELIAFHKSHPKSYATVTATQPPTRFGCLALDGERVTHFQEKPDKTPYWINSGFFVLSPKVFDYIDGDATSWENAPLERLATEGKLNAYKHDGFFHPMDTMKDKEYLESLWQKNEAPWKTWEDNVPVIKRALHHHHASEDKIAYLRL